MSDPIAELTKRVEALENRFPRPAEDDCGVTVRHDPLYRAEWKVWRDGTEVYYFVNTHGITAETHAECYAIGLRQKIKEGKL